jgi:RNA recognition motif-containing protein
VAKKIFVGNLAFGATEQDVEALFAEIGTCDSVSVVTDRMTGRSRGFAFVEMSSDADAERAIESLNGREVQGRALTVNEARERSRDGGGGGGGQRRGGSSRGERY